jgi:hypothetical protein
VVYKEQNSKTYCLGKHYLRTGFCQSTLVQVKFLHKNKILFKHVARFLRNSLDKIFPGMLRFLCISQLCHAVPGGNMTLNQGLEHTSYLLVFPESGIWQSYYVRMFAPWNCK